MLSRKSSGFLSALEKNHDVWRQGRLVAPILSRAIDEQRSRSRDSPQLRKPKTHT
jgi:hypothetical protein